MSAFSIGDRIRCVDPGFANGLVKGETYIVTEQEGVLLTLDHGGPALDRRFELVAPAAAQATKILDGATVSTDSVSEAGEDGWWDVVPTPRMEDGLAVTRGWAGALGLEVRVQVRRAVS